MMTWRASISRPLASARSAAASSRALDLADAGLERLERGLGDDQRGVADHVDDARRADRQHVHGRDVAKALQRPPPPPGRRGPASGPWRPTWRAPRRPASSTARRRPPPSTHRDRCRASACTESAERSARRRALRLTLKVWLRGFGPNATPPPRRCGTLSAPTRARPVPFCCQAFAVVIDTSPRPRVDAVPRRRAARSARAASWTRLS